MELNNSELIRKLESLTAIDVEYRNELLVAVRYFHDQPNDFIACTAHLRKVFEEYLIEYLIKAFVGKTQNSQVRSRLEQLTKMGVVSSARRDAFLSVWSQLSEMIHQGVPSREALASVFHVLLPLLDWFDGKKREREQRVMLLYHLSDRATVDAISRELEKAGLTAVGEDHYCFGKDEPWPGDDLENEVRSCANVVAVVGAGKSGPWQHGKMIHLLYNQIQADKTFHALGAMLPGADAGLLPRFLQSGSLLTFEHHNYETLPSQILQQRTVDSEPGWQLVEGASPYPGLRSFAVEDAHLFFGRNERIVRLLDAITPSADPRLQNRFLAILGASGSGKSSLAQAGLLAALREGALPSSEHWLQVVCRPGRRPLENLTQQLYANSEIAKHMGDFGEFVKQLRSDREKLHWTVKAVLAAKSKTDRLVVLVDQFEELFNECEDVEKQAAFIDNLVHAGTELDGQTIVIVTLRVDYYDRCVDFAELWDALAANQEAAPPMGDRELREAINEPARKAGRQVEPGLTELLIRDMHNHKAALPLLQHVLHQMWDEKAGLSIEQYEKLGGLEGALEKHANQVFNSFDQQQKAVCQQVLLELTRPGADSSQDTRRRLPLKELCRLLDDAETVERVVKELASEKARLLICDREEESDGKVFVTVEVAHEALIRNWSKLRGWLDEVRDSRRFEQVLEEATLRWEQYRRNETNLSYQGKRLREAVLWAERNPQRVKPLVDAFLNHCVVKDVEQLLKYDLQRLSLALKEFGVLRNRARHFLESVCNSSDAESRERLVAAVALLPLDSSQLPFLTQRLLEGSIDEFKLLCEEMKQYCENVADLMWRMLDSEEEEGGRRFRAALALARGVELDSSLYDRWRQHAKFIANRAIDVVNVDPASYGVVLETLTPFADGLREHWLEVFLHGVDPTRWTSVSRFLADTSEEGSEILSEMLLEAKPAQFPTVMDRASEVSDLAVAGARRELSCQLADLPTEEEKERCARRQANASVVLLHLRNDPRAFDLLRHSEDPRARSHLIHKLAELDVSPEVLRDRWHVEQDVSVRRALLLALGQYSDDEGADQTFRESFAPELIHVHRTHIDAGVHGAAEWLMRQWGLNVEIDALESTALDAETRSTASWHVDSEQHTFVTLDAGTFLMGSHPSDPQKQSNEIQHQRTINRRFCMAAYATTRAQYKRFFEDTDVDDIINEDYIRAIVPDERSPMTYVTWYEAAWYCNWLSEKAGIPEEQWCYQPNAEGQYGLGMRPRDNYLSLVGFRLPTEAEWEFACRAGTTTRRYYGHCDELLAHYASFHDNTQGHTAKVGVRKPNDYGLFDMHGGVWTWCNDPVKEYIDPSADQEDCTPLGSEIRVLRGGAFGNMSPHVRSACRNKLNRGDHRFHQLGFRVARTCPQPSSNS